VFIRLAWHAAGTYDKRDGSGGSSGATMRYEPESTHGANAGLAVARDRLEAIKKKYPAITYADLWSLAGVVALQVRAAAAPAPPACAQSPYSLARNHHTPPAVARSPQEMGGPTIPWRAGRADATAEKCTPDGRLPDATKKADHLRAVFGRMGFSDAEIVALSGAHGMGRCHGDRSGFVGPWTFSPTTFSNAFFTELLGEKWVAGPAAPGGPTQFRDAKTGR
jgi:cytochrome c peroxidase